MAGDIVNLRKARKARARAKAEVQAAENRILFGRTKGERKATDAERERALRAIDGHRREAPGREPRVQEAPVRERPAEGGDER